MMIILHGLNIVESRKELENLKNQAKGQEMIILDGARLDLGELKQALEAKSLFGQEKLVVLENLFGAKKKTKEQEKIIDYLKKAKQDTDLIIWEDQEVGKAFLHFFPYARVKIFKPDPLLFRFLETLRPSGSQDMIESFRKVTAREDANLIFNMIIRQFRLLLFLKAGEGNFEEVERLADWQKTKIAKQAQYFAMEKLLRAYRELLTIDYQEKTGLTPYSLSQTLELFLANL